MAATWIKVKTQKINMDLISEFYIESDGNANGETDYSIVFIEHGGYDKRFVVPMKSKEETAKYYKIINNKVGVVDIDRLVK